MVKIYLGANGCGLYGYIYLEAQNPGNFRFKGYRSKFKVCCWSASGLFFWVVGEFGNCSFCDFWDPDTFMAHEEEGERIILANTIGFQQLHCPDPQLGNIHKIKVYPQNHLPRYLHCNLGIMEIATKIFSLETCISTFQGKALSVKYVVMF